MFSFKSLKINIKELKVESHSLVGINSLFFPISGGNYFSIKYKDKICNIMNMSLENFEELKKSNIEIELIEILKDNISTNGYLLFSKDILSNWYLNGIWTYNTSLNSDDKEKLVEYLKLKNVYLYQNKIESTIKEDIENLLLNKYKCKSYKFNYLNKEDELIIRAKKDLIDRNEETKDYKNIYFIRKLNPMYKITFYDIFNIMINLKKDQDVNSYFDESYLGYVIIDENKNFNYYILNNENLINFINENKIYDDFANKCNNLTDNGKYKFYSLLEKEKKENKEKQLNGSSLNKVNATIYFQQMLNRLNNLPYINYMSIKEFDFDVNLFVEKLFEYKILKSDNELYAKSNSTKNSYTYVYFYECIIEKIINENEFIARISSNNNSFYYIKFIKENNVWDFQSVKRKQEIIINYE